MITATKFEYEGYDVTKELYKDDEGIKTHFTKGIVYQLNFRLFHVL